MGVKGAEQETNAHDVPASILVVGLGSSPAALVDCIRERHIRRNCGMIPMLGMDTSALSPGPIRMP